MCKIQTKTSRAAADNAKANVAATIDYGQTGEGSTRTSTDNKPGGGERELPKVVYHWKATNFSGSSIIDLYTLKQRMPDLFEGQNAKYGTTAVRKHILSNTMIPNLDGCLWNGAIHTSTIHPQHIIDAKRKHGLPVGGELVGREYFVIPVQKLLNDPKVEKMVHWNFPQIAKTTMLGFVLNTKLLGHVFGEWNKQDFPVLDQEYLETTFENRVALSPQAEEAYASWGEATEKGETPQVLTYIGMPHVLVRGEIDIEGLEIIRVV